MIDNNSKSAEVYREEVRSIRTSLLFLGLAAVSFGLFIWRVTAVGFRFVPGLFLVISLFFGFYFINFRTLKISITNDSINLRFGVIGWKTDLKNVASIQADDSPFWIKYGGAGVHFAFVNKKYRGFFNFLEHPRVLIDFRRKQGLVQQLTFTTREPEAVQRFVRDKVEKL